VLHGCYFNGVTLNAPLARTMLFREISDILRYVIVSCMNWDTLNCNCLCNIFLIYLYVRECTIYENIQVRISSSLLICRVRINIIQASGNTKDARYNPNCSQHSRSLSSWRIFVTLLAANTVAATNAKCHLCRTRYFRLTRFYFI
jgi:hypothetical protein